MSTTRKDAGRPRVSCLDCRFHDPEDRLCPFARKVPVRTGTLTCQCFKPIRARDRQSSPPRPFEIETDPDRALVTLTCHGLADLVTEVAVFDGQLGIRFARSVTLENMESVVEALRVTVCETHLSP